mmetsp:Transcript_83104/g.173967  ORF Transcript_83104/g.173967 Transcript_83104/m.173967 type:complete len:557 (+) Transcript_83104:95-1765(+)|eukprot:CAMPEP_0206423986 /NCGR_PEP_ID=MMETSP0324_2-20121206/2974_1 /ASSEMBLY_ACC=CAM_ASM_000836 /TAXON_ID=2866 /ORGANISM="Crypthecodinium cohnii, Strain Seligo" /LENGTH=556 /DNA_ID=CAMNT_0053888585 /DNA_START=51 /DNA_END=1721 /DNA_ORIENTATION=-
MNLLEEPMFIIPIQGQHRAVRWSGAKHVLRQVQEDLRRQLPPTKTCVVEPQPKGEADEHGDDSATDIGTTSSLGNLADLEFGGPMPPGKCLDLSGHFGKKVQAKLGVFRDLLRDRDPDYFPSLANELAHILYATAIEDLCEFQVAMDCTCDELRNDKDIMLELVRHNGVAWYYASEELCANKEVMLEAVKHNWAALGQASLQLRDDKGVVLQSVKSDWRSYRDASDRLQEDREILIEALKQDGQALHDAGSNLQADRELVLMAVKNDHDSENHRKAMGIDAHEAFLHARAITGSTCYRDWMELYERQYNRPCPALASASEALRADRELVLAALEVNWEALEGAADHLQADRDIVIDAVKQSALALQFASEELRADKDVRLIAARYGVPNRDKMWHQFKVHSDLRHDVPYEIFQQEFMAPVESAVAVQGDDDAPILTLSLSYGRTQSKKFCEEEKMSFHCEVYLMSGSSFVCSIPDHPYSDRCGQSRPGPVVNDLAKKLVKELPKHTEIAGAKRIFINIIVDHDGGAVAITPWDWDKPLTTYLLPAAISMATAGGGA